MRLYIRYLCGCLPLLVALSAAGAGVRADRSRAWPAPTGGAAGAQASDDTSTQAAATEKLAAVKKHIADLARAQRETAGKRDSINSQLAAQADKLDAAARAVRESEAAIAANQHKLDALEQQRDELQASLDSQRDALADLLRAAYKIRPGSDLRLLLGDADMARLARALAYSRYFQHDRIAHIRTLLGKLDDLNRVGAEIARKRQALEAAHAQKQQHMAALNTTRQKQQALLAQVTAQLHDQHQQMQQLKRNRQALNDLLVKLRDVFADIPDKLPADVPFAKRRGDLPWPVHGKASQRSEGLHIGAERGTPVHAVAHGRVAYADWLRGYGLLVIIDHGNGWMSLYGNNESLLVGVGDWVRSGQPIATAGASVGDDAGVYFGLRHDGQPVKALPWLAKP